MGLTHPKLRFVSGIGLPSRGQDLRDSQCEFLISRRPRARLAHVLDAQDPDGLAARANRRVEQRRDAASLEIAANTIRSRILEGVVGCHDQRRRDRPKVRRCIDLAKSEAPLEPLSPGVVSELAYDRLRLFAEAPVAGAL